MIRFLIAGIAKVVLEKPPRQLQFASAEKMHGYDLASFKCGPDYTDPMFHREVLKIPSFNLDLFFCKKRDLRQHFFRNAKEISVIRRRHGILRWNRRNRENVVITKSQKPSL